MRRREYRWICAVPVYLLSARCVSFPIFLPSSPPLPPPFFFFTRTPLCLRLSRPPLQKGQASHPESVPSRLLLGRSKHGTVLVFETRPVARRGTRGFFLVLPGTQRGRGRGRERERHHRCHEGELPLRRSVFCRQRPESRGPGDERPYQSEEAEVHGALLLVVGDITCVSWGSGRATGGCMLIFNTRASTRGPACWVSR